MNKEIIQNNIEADVLKKIEQGSVKMKPKSYFFTKMAVLVSLTIITFVTTMILVSFLIFSLSNRGDLFLLSLGTKGIYRFILVFPWYLLLINAFLLIFLDYLLRRFKYGYNSPIVYLFLGTLVFVTAFSFLVNFTSFHLRLSEFAQRNKLPLAEGMYRDIRSSRRDRGVYRGTVTSIGQNFITVEPFLPENGQKGEIRVYAPEGVDLKSFVEVGQEIYIAGYMATTATGTEVASFGIRKIER